MITEITTMVINGRYYKMIRFESRGYAGSTKYSTKTVEITKEEYDELNVKD